MGTKSWLQIKTEQRQLLWPFPTEARTLIAVHDALFIEGAMELQAAVECLKNNNTTIVPACGTLFHCGKTVFDAPYGHITRVFTVANDDWCDPVRYRFSHYDAVECWSKNLLDYELPLNVGYDLLPKGFLYADANSDSTVGRARVGIFAIHKRKFWMAPWIQSNEKVVIEWDGVKSEWNDTDLLDLTYWTPLVLKALRSYVRWKHESEYGDPNVAREKERDWLNNRADCMYECHENTRQREEEVCDNDRLPTAEEVAADEVPAESDSVVIGYISDFDGRTSQARAVADMVNGWSPAAIVTGGDNIYENTDRETNIRELYGDFITDSLATNRCFPALGNHDYDDGGIQGHYDFFKLPNNERYYDVVIGPVHFFIVNTQVQEPDGRTSTSVQADWLRAKLALSTATWKVVVCQDAPFTTAPADDPGHSFIRWPFGTWGADLVLSGDTHAYERFEGVGDLDGVPCIVGGWSGRTPLDTLSGATDAVIKKQYDDKHGAIKITASESALTCDAINVDGETIDTLTLT